jgi:protein TonB
MSAIVLPGGLPLREAPRAVTAPRVATPPLAPPLPQRPRAAATPVRRDRGKGLAFVVGLHALLLWGLSSGLARQALEIVKKPIQTVILTEAPPPPPPPPPRIEKVQAQPKLPPPPAYVPPTEVAVTPPPAPVIQAVQTTQAVAPPPAEPPAPVVAAAPPPPAVVKREISLACPGYQAILAQTLEEAIERVGLKGTVNTLIKIRGTQVVDVIPQTGPKEYHKYVINAVKRMRCTAGGADEVQVSLPVIFS